MDRHLELERFDSVVDRIRQSSPGLHVEVQKEHPHVHALAQLPVQPGVQPGLDFRISLTLQNRDELHLSAGHFWVEWFPVGSPEVFEQISAAVVGLISGDYRIVESYVFGRAVRASLERPGASGGWETVATWSNLGGLIPWTSKRNMIQNTGS
ncbi:MAG: hypothetical protein M3P38_04150 [Chloroflexota bacterium]|nr:hypothetical protein [Chloroflexota bacterium]